MGGWGKSQAILDDLYNTKSLSPLEIPRCLTIFGYVGDSHNKVSHCLERLFLNSLKPDCVYCVSEPGNHISNNWVLPVGQANWKPRIVMMPILWSLETQERVITSTSVSTGDEKVDIVTNLRNMSEVMEQTYITKGDILCGQSLWDMLYNIYYSSRRTESNLGNPKWCILHFPSTPRRRRSLTSFTKGKDPFILYS